MKKTMIVVLALVFTVGVMVIFPRSKQNSVEAATGISQESSSVEAKAVFHEKEALIPKESPTQGIVRVTIDLDLTTLAKVPTNKNRAVKVKNQN